MSTMFFGNLLNIYHTILSHLLYNFVLSTIIYK